LHNIIIEGKLILKSYEEEEYANNPKREENPRAERFSKASVCRR
jgi:hypothetical protein